MESAAHVSRPGPLRRADRATDSRAPFTPGGVQVLLCALAILGCSQALSLPARAALPETLRVPIPSGEVVEISLPPGMCGYPLVVRNALEGYLAAGEPKLHLIGAAGDCYAIDRFVHGHQAPISPTIELSMLENQVPRAGRMSPAQYHQYCLERAPANGDVLLTDVIRTDLQKLDRGLTLTREVSLGELARTPDSTFEGLLAKSAKGRIGMIQAEITACFAPRGVPLLWTFSVAMDPTASPGEIETRLKAALSVTESEISATLRLNPRR